jgi:hypothetical protein
LQYVSGFERNIDYSFKDGRALQELFQRGGILMGRDQRYNGRK